MTVLKYSKSLGRKSRLDKPADLAISNWDLLRKAIKENKADDALELVDYLAFLDSQPGLHGFTSNLLTRVADLAGEEEVIKMWYERSYPIMKRWLDTNPTVLDSLQWCTELQRSHSQGTFTVTEEPDRFVVTYPHCHSGGVVRQAANIGKSKKGYPWTWGKAGVPYYCTHCALRWEIIPIDLRGYPVRINLFNDDPKAPCIHLFYKKPELIPEEYFTRVGKKKTIK